MLNLNHLIQGKNSDIQIFMGDWVGAGATTWKTWVKPNGATWVYMLAVGAGGGGGIGISTGTSSGGGGGGGSGSQSSLFIPATLLPDVLYILAGQGGAGGVISAGSAGAGNTYINLAPSTSPSTDTNGRWLFAGTGGGGGQATASAGGAAGTAGTVCTLAIANLAGKGIPTFIAGQAGIIGGAGTPVAGGNLTLPATGLMVTGGVGGGGSNTAAATPALGGGTLAWTIAPLGSDAFYIPSAAAGASGATPAGAGISGYIAKNFMFNFGGTGGGGASGTAGGLAGSGGNGAPGCGGGGAGGRNTTNTGGGVGGAGGPGFVIIISGIA